MKINYVKQIEFEELAHTDFDFIVCASGFEERSTYSSKILDRMKVFTSYKICFSFKGRKLHSKIENDEYFRKNKFSFISVESNDIDYYVDKFLVNISQRQKEKNKERISIFIDYSCMITIIYAGLLKCLNRLDIINTVDVYFSYSHAKLTESKVNNPLSFNHPIPLFDHIQSTNKKVALLLGMGYEENKALGLHEYFQSTSEDIYLFIIRNNGFYEKVLTSNQHLINMVNKSNIIYYELENLNPLINTLDSMVNFLIYQDYRVVLAPIGPKIFNLIALIVNMYHREVTTYRLSDGNNGNPINKIADETKMPTIVHLNMINHK
ncbi:hypothetical protein [Flectobacillus roseus]|uniref:Uncharacterized protein n=1 Tax=Flectobacillus roseus TaxID=502259 RepID=A0ABT6Y4D9_9BACT|nr:hypothetical protein [Flectobacillus roseus]MDI9857968.1 hypothetical protein [Flectobacillus roseus]